MKATELVKMLHSAGDVEVVIHDPTTDDELPVIGVKSPYGGPVVLIVEANDA